MTTVPSFSCKLVHSFAVKVFPLSEVAWSGKPNLLIQEVMSALVQFSAVACGMGTASRNLLVRSIMVNKYRMPSVDVGKGPTTSSCKSPNRLALTGICLIDGAIFLCIFVF